MNPVTLPRPIVNQILHQAQQAEGEEICGLIAGNAKISRAVIRWRMSRATNSGCSKWTPRD